MFTVYIKVQKTCNERYLHLRALFTFKYQLVSAEKYQEK